MFLFGQVCLPQMSESVLINIIFVKIDGCEKSTGLEKSIVLLNNNDVFNNILELTRQFMLFMIIHTSGR